MGDIDIDRALGWRGRTVRDRDGEEVGRLGDIYLDPRTDRPAWASVRTGLFGRRETIIPLGEIRDADDELHLPYDAARVKEAPNVDPDIAPTPEEEERLFAHYGIRDDAATPGAETADVERRDVAASTEPSRDDEANDDASHATEAEMTRSEEEVAVRPGPMRSREKVRLRKVLVTDEVRKTVPRRREVVQLETDPPPEGEIEAVHEVPPDEQARS
jgi:hypothetical protein